MNIIFGLFCVFFSHIILILYFYFMLHYTNPIFIHQEKNYNLHRNKTILFYIKNHFSNLEGFFLLTLYILFVNHFQLLPSSYYDYSSFTIQIENISGFLVILDFLQYWIHRFEHFMSKYKFCKFHKYHHIHVKPLFYHAFQGHVFDTFIMILIPLYTVSQIVLLNAYSYILMGCLYSCWLTLIHSEFCHPWDDIFKKCSFGTPVDHHIHHTTFKYNYGHLFMFWDKFFGTYL